MRLAVYLLVLLGWCIAGAWALMLLAGIIRGSWISALPPLGFHAAFLLSALWCVAKFISGLTVELIKMDQENLKKAEPKHVIRGKIV